MCKSVPGNFLVRKEAFVIIDLDTVAVALGDNATLMPIGPSLR